MPSRCRAAWNYTQTATTDNLTAFSVAVPSLGESALRIFFTCCESSRYKLLFFPQMLSRIVRILLARSLLDFLLLFGVQSLATSSVSFVYHLYFPIYPQYICIMIVVVSLVHFSGRYILCE